MAATLKVAVPAMSHAFWTTRTEDGEVIVKGGTDAEFLGMIMTKVRSNYSVVVPTDNAWGSLVNGSWTGIIGMINRGEVDMALGTLSITEERSKAVDFSYPYKIKNIVFAIKPQMLRSRDIAFVLPFSKDIWFGILMLLILLPFVFRAVNFKRYKLDHLFLKVLAILLHQSPTFRVHSKSQNILLVACFVGTYLLTLTYSSVLLSFLTVPLKSAGIENRYQLAKALVTDRSFKCYTFAGTSYLERLLRSSQKSTRVIGNFIKEKNWLLKIGSTVTATYISKGKTAVITSADSIALTFQDNIFVSEDHFFSMYVAVAFRKSFRYKKEVDKVIHEITAAGTYQKNEKDYQFKMRLISNRIHAGDHQERDSTNEQLSVSDLKGSFVLLIFGHILAFVSFSLEILYSKVKNFRFQRAPVQRITIFKY